jgi:hypothetical protein
MSVRANGGTGPRIPLVAPRLSPHLGQQVAAGVQAELLADVFARRKVLGSGQEMGDGADGPAVNLRRSSLSLLAARMDRDVLLAELRAHGGRWLKNLLRDLEWLDQAERQPVASDRPFDFRWSENPMSTPEVLTTLAERRAEAARRAAEALALDPSRPHDASNDGLLTHLHLSDPDLRAQVLFDTLIQQRAQRRSEVLMDGALAPEQDPLARQADGRIGSSGVVAAFEQRLALTELPRGHDLEARRERALLRLIVGSSTTSSVNTLYAARNAVAVLSDYLDRELFAKVPGFATSLHDAIHKEYSANTPRLVDHYLTELCYTEGPKADRTNRLSALLAAARAPTLKEAQDKLPPRDPDWPAFADLEQLRRAVAKQLTSHCKVPTLKRGLSVDGVLKAYELLHTVHRSICSERPNAATLRRQLFYAGPATNAVATLIGALEQDDHPAQVEALGRARQSLTKAIDRSASGFERQMMLRLDRDLELLSAELLGATLSRLEGELDERRLGELVLGLRSALRGTLASGLDGLRVRPRTAPGPDLQSLARTLDQKIAVGSITADELRALSIELYAAATECSDAIRGAIRRREAAIHFGGLDVRLDPELPDNLIKESALHALLGLAQRGMTLGLKAEVGPDEIRLIEGARVLNAVGPRVYQRVLVAKTPEALARYRPGPNDLCVVQSAPGKNLVYGGGLIVDAKEAGPGYSHLSVYAKGHAVSALGLPNLGHAVRTFFDRVKREGGVYVDDRPGNFVIKPLGAAIEAGLLTAADVPRLQPGFNLNVESYGTNAEGQRILAGRKEVKVHPDRPERTIQLLVPDLQDNLHLGGPVPFAALEDRPLDQVRQVAGEKGAVLVALSKVPELAQLGVKILPGAVVPPFAVAELLRACPSGRGTLFDRWQVALQAPTPRRLAAAQAEVKRSLQEHLLTAGKPNAEGRRLLAQLAKAPGLAGPAPWILRSSFTGEDRPYKSGAGQYDSFPNCRTGAERLLGLIGVIASAFNPGAVAGNQAAGIGPNEVWPSVLAQRSLDAQLSGVAISRGDKGGYGQVSYQAVKGTGGGVEGGPAEEGVLGQTPTNLLSPRLAAQLKAAVLAIERAFHTQIEPGQQHAVDVEWAVEKGQLYILQARVIVGV